MSGYADEQVEAGQGRELLRQLLQDHLDLRAVREQRQQRVVDAEQVAHTRAEPGHQRGLATVFGQVTVSRMGYRAPGARNLYPADAVLNLPAGLHSLGLRRLAAVESVRGSFQAAGEAIWRASGTRIGKRQVEALAQAAAVDIEAFYAARRPKPAEPDRLLVLSFDGKGIVMIPSAPREATARAAARSRRKLSTRLSAGEKNGRKRMAELAAVYDAVPVPRTATDVIGRPEAGGGRPTSWILLASMRRWWLRYGQRRAGRRRVAGQRGRQPRLRREAGGRLTAPGHGAYPGSAAGLVPGHHLPH